MKPGLESPILPAPEPSEERFRLIFEQAAVGVALTDRQTGRFVKVNQKYCDILGYSVAEMLEKRFQDVTYPDDLQTDLSRTAQLGSGECDSFTWEKRYLHESGAIIWANLTVSTLYAVGEVPRLNIATVEDVTARKHAEAALLEANEELEVRVRLRTAELEAANRQLQEEITERGVAEESLRESEQRFRTMADSISQLAWVSDSDGGICWLNRRCYEYTGLALEQMHGWEWQGLVEPATLPEVLERWLASISSGEPFDMEFPLLGRDGNYRRFLARVAPLKDGEGAVVQWFGTCTDITALKQTEEELRRHRDGLDLLVRERTAELEGRNAQLEVEIAERRRAEGALSQSEQRFRAVVEDQTELIARYSPDGSYLFVNEVFCRFLGKSEAELLGNRWQPHVNQEDLPGTEKRLAFLTPGNPVVVVENRVISGTVEERWMQFVYRGFFDGAGRLLETQAVARDITERKLAEEGLRRYARRLVELEENLRKRIAMELHDDIGQALTALGLNLAHIDCRLKRGDGKDLAEVLEDSRQLTKEISRTVRNLMVDLHPAQLEEYGLAAAVRSHAEQFTQRTGIQVAVLTDPACPRLTAAQEITLFRITQEALNNIVKYAAASQVTVSLNCADDLLRFSIADDGAGFLPRAVSPQPTGSGWGLTNMRERAELIGGVFRVASAPGAGTTVSVDFRGPR